jgi:limonene-1,2-epoxide hydrolase
MGEYQMMPDDFVKKNIEMWEKFTSTYMDTMFKTVERTMDQSQVLRERVDKAVEEAVSTQMEATMQMLEAMGRQLEALSQKVDKMMEQES